MQESGKGIYEEFKERIADPIGMEDFIESDGAYYYDPISIHPAYLFRLTARDAARFGLLCLEYGEWNGIRIVSEEWMKESTTSHSYARSDAGSSGYGYMWWAAVAGKLIPQITLKKNCFAARGIGGQYILVIPDMDLVVVHLVDADNGDSVTPVQFGMLMKLILEASAF